MKKIVLQVLNLTALSFFLFVIFSTEYKFDKIINSQNLRFFCLAIIFLLISQLNVGLVWSLYLKKSSGVPLKLSFTGWINSIKGKYVPGKITSPILRIENVVNNENKKHYYIIILIENIYLVVSNIFLGGYVFLKEFYSFKFHLVFYLIINLLLYSISKIKRKDIYFEYLSFSYLFQFTNLFNLMGIYFASKIFFFENAFEFSLIYQLSIAVSMIISIFPAGIGIREASAIEIAKNYPINIVEMNNAVIFYRILSVLTDSFLIFTEYIIKYKIIFRNK